MIKPRLRTRIEIRSRLENMDFAHAGDIEVESGNYSVWVAPWGEPLMIPEEGPDRVCADFVIEERLQAVMATKPPTRKK